MYLLLFFGLKRSSSGPLGQACNYTSLEHQYVKLFQTTIKSFYEESVLCIQ